MKQDISNEIEKIISYCKSKECDECKYRANDDLCNLHNPTAWNVNQMNEKEAIEQLKIIKTNIDKKYINTKNSKSIETVLNLIEKQKHIIEGKEALIDTMTYNEEVYEEILKKKDKIIYEIAKAFKQDDIRSVEEIVEYFNKKIEKGE